VRQSSDFFFKRIFRVLDIDAGVDGGWVLGGKHARIPIKRFHQKENFFFIITYYKNFSLLAQSLGVHTTHTGSPPRYLPTRYFHSASANSSNPVIVGHKFNCGMRIGTYGELTVAYLSTPSSYCTLRTDVYSSSNTTGTQVVRMHTRIPGTT